MDGRAVWPRVLLAAAVLGALAALVYHTFASEIQELTVGTFHFSGAPEKTRLDNPERGHAAGWDARGRGWYLSWSPEGTPGGYDLTVVPDFVKLIGKPEETALPVQAPHPLTASTIDVQLKARRSTAVLLEWTCPGSRRQFHAIVWDPSPEHALAMARLAVEKGLGCHPTATP